MGRRAAVGGRVAGHRLRRRRDRPHGGHLPRGAGVPRGQAAGAHRRADRPGQPPRAARRGGPGADDGLRAPPGRAAAARPRRLQGGQRQPRPHRRRPPAPADRPAAAAGAAPRRGPGPSRRRRVRRPAARGRARRGAGAGRAAPEADPAAVPGRGHPAARRASASASRRRRCPRPRSRRCCAAPTSRCTRRSPRARACTSTCPTRTAAAATGCARWRSCASRCSSDQLVVHLQPQIALTDERVVGVEALVRWNHPVRGLLSPADLLPAAEQAGLLRPLTDTVLELALTATARWWRARAGAGVGQPRRRPTSTTSTCPSKVAAALRRHGLPPEALTLELVEDTLMADPERGRQVLGRAPPARRPDVDRRLRHRLQLAGLPAAPARRRAQARPEPDGRRRPGPPRGGDRAAHRRAGPRARPPAGRRGRRGRRHRCACWRGLGCDIAQGYAIARPMPVDDFLRWLVTPRPLLLEQSRA